MLSSGVPCSRFSSSSCSRRPTALFAQSKDDKKKDEAQKKEIQSIVKIVDDAGGRPAGGQRPVADAGFARTC